jgi:pimeloyl-ACP methyl ester carboxylesterase
MALAGFSSFSPRPVLDALRHPLRRLVRDVACPSLQTAGGKVYLGEGQPVMVFPVLGGGAESTVRLRAALARAGFSAYDWGLGLESGPGEFGLDQCLRRLEEQVIELFEAERRPITLLGWSLSGIYAREVAKRIDPLVRQVITLGTPFNTMADPRRQCEMLRALEGGERLDAAIWQRIAQRPTVPCTSIYSMSDNAAPWQLCVQSESATFENVQVMVDSHLEMPSHPKVLEVITHRLAQPAGEWRSFRS